MSTIEALIALTSFILVLAVFVYGIRTTLHARVREARYELLKAKGEAISQLTALLLELNPSILNERQMVKTFLENNLKEYIHKRILDSNVTVIQTTIRISFPNVLYKDIKGRYNLQPAITYYIVNFSSTNRPTLSKAEGPFTFPPNSRMVIVTAGSIYALGFELVSNIDQLPTLTSSRSCFIIYSERGEACVLTLVFEGDNKFGFNSSCYPTPYSNILQAENLKNLFRIFLENNILKPPYAIVCDGKCFIYPSLHEPLILFREEVPGHVLLYRATSLARVGDVLVLIEVIVWE